MKKRTKQVVLLYVSSLLSFQVSLNIGIIQQHHLAYHVKYGEELRQKGASVLPLSIVNHFRAANNFPAGTSQIVRSNLVLLGHIPFLAGQTLIIIILNLENI